MNEIENANIIRGFCIVAQLSPNSLEALAKTRLKEK